MDSSAERAQEGTDTFEETLRRGLFELAQQLRSCHEKSLQQAKLRDAAQPDKPLEVSATPPLPGSEEPKAELQGPNQSERASMSSFYPLPDKADFRILEDWSKTAKVQIPDHRGVSVNAQKLRYLDNESEEEVDCLSGRLKPLMMSPGSPRRICWDVISAVLIAADAILIPLQLLVDGDGWTVINWVFRAFWTTDLGMNFLRGYARGDGSVEMSPRKAALHYLKTWFALDFAIVCLDWLDLVDLENASRLGRSVKMIRFLKVARLIRLVRFSRMNELIGHIAAFFRSGMFPTIMGIFKIMTGMMIFWHLLACVWYRLAADAEGSNWIESFNYAKEDLGHLYFISLHWALTLFIGTMEVTPQNFDERVLTVVALYFSFFLSAAVISAITSSMTKLDLLTVQRDSKLTALKQYLFDNNVSPRLTLRIQRSVVMAIQEQEKDVPEHKIELLSLAAESLKTDLHFERYMPILSQHPLFFSLQGIAEDVTRRFCHTAISRMSMAPSEAIITNETTLVQSDMYFLESGSAVYISYQGHFALSSNSPYPWLCEAALWTYWTNIGTCLAKTHCSLLRVDGAKFRQVAQSAAHPDFLKFVQKYSEKFVMALNQQEPEDLSDLHENRNCDLDEIVEKTREEVCENGPKTRAMKTFMSKQKRKSWFGARVADISAHSRR